MSVEPGTRNVRAALYVDGFNLYHALADLNQPHLKWLDLSKLAKALVVGVQPREEVVRIVVCTASRVDKPDKLTRHRSYISALEAAGVEVIIGHFSTEARHCRACGNTWDHPTEKQGDVNLALALIDGAYQDLFDTAYLLTADGDQAATASVFKRRFPGKKLISVSPPERRHSRQIVAHAHGTRSITIDMLEIALFDRMVPVPSGGYVRRPEEYDPPPHWLPPALRSKKKCPLFKPPPGGFFAPATSPRAMACRPSHAKSARRDRGRPLGPSDPLE